MHTRAHTFRAHHQQPASMPHALAASAWEILSQGRVSLAGGSEGRSAIQALLKIIQAGPKAAKPSQGDEVGGEAAEEGEDPMLAGTGQGAKRRGKASSRSLNRPLIAICNDLYAPALRPLRNIARILQFKAPQVPHSPVGC